MSASLVFARGGPRQDMGPLSDGMCVSLHACMHALSVALAIGSSIANYSYGV